MRKIKKPLANTAIITGSILMLLSFSAYFYKLNGFISEVHSEIFGAGIAIFIFGLIYLLFGRRIG